jgi:hypothetical protein
MMRADPTPEYRYSAYGLTFAVPFACPALTSAPDDSTVDVRVTPGDVPRSLPQPEASERGWDATSTSFLVRAGKRAGRFLAVDGQVTLQRGQTADDAVVARFFTDRVMAAVLRQHGMLVLHASAALTPTGAVLIGGESGAGKSTTLSALLAAGCTMLSDDVTALRRRDDGDVEVVPGAAQLHLGQDAATELAVDISSAPLQQWRRMKAAVQTHQQMATEAKPLRTIYCVRTAAHDDVVVRRLAGAARFDAIQSCLYGPASRDEHGALFDLLRAVATHDVFELSRPANRWSVVEVVRAILHGTCEEAA